MRLKTYISLVCCVLLSGLLFICFIHKPNIILTNNEITTLELQNHVTFLSSETLEGRQTGTTGEKLATQYVADVFHRLGLEPAGDNGSYFQEFNFTSGVSLGENNSLSLTDQHGRTKLLALGQEWRPLSFSDNHAFSHTNLIFAGYGITAPALGDLPAYDSYRDLNVKDKWVIVFRYTPEKFNDNLSRQLSQYASLRYKAFTAKEHGAKGIIFVSGPNAKVRNELIPLSFDTSLSGSGIIALSVKDDVISQLLKYRHYSLKKLQDKFDSGESVQLPDLSGINMTGQTDIKQNQQRGRNVLAKLKVNTTATQMLIVGAHIDHLGRGELSGSRARENEKTFIHAGADDNASGVASMLAAARTLSDLKSRGKLHGNKNILFAAWSGEELGLLGSEHFVKNMMAKASSKSLRSTIIADINLDMVGRLRENLILQGAASSSMWPELIKQVNAKQAIHFTLQSDPYLPTDTTSFYLHGVPTLNFFTGSHDEYHTPRDKPETLNYIGIKTISTFLVKLILAVENEPLSFDYQQVQKTGDNTGRGFRVYLGTIPDYASADVAGVKLAGVTKDSPANRAGVKQGDIVIALAGKKIHDIYDYSFVLGSLHAGEPVTLIVLRGQTRQTLTIVPRSRE